MDTSAASTRAAGTGRIVTTMFPENGPLASHGRLVLYREGKRHGCQVKCGFSRGGGGGGRLKVYVDLYFCIFVCVCASVFP